MSAAEHLRAAAAAARAQAEALDAAARDLESNVVADAPYTSVELPPDCPSRERFRRLAARIRREQGDDAARRSGQLWIVERAAWAKLRGVVKAPSVEPDEGDVDAVDALRRAGLRVVGGSK